MKNCVTLSHLCQYPFELGMAVTNAVLLRLEHD